MIIDTLVRIIIVLTQTTLKKIYLGINERTEIGFLISENNEILVNITMANFGTLY